MSYRATSKTRRARAEIQQQVADFIARGGVVQQVPQGLSGLDETGLSSRGREIKNKHSKGRKARKGATV